MHTYIHTQHAHTQYAHTYTHTRTHIYTHTHTHTHTYTHTHTQKLDEDGLLLRVTRSDKEEIIFYNNPEYMLPSPLSEEFRSLWHRVSVDGLTETDIEKYLERVGLAAMSAQSSERKRKAPSQQRQPRKRAKNVKIVNTHLDSELFSDDSKTQS